MTCTSCTPSASALRRQAATLCGSVTSSSTRARLRVLPASTVSMRASRSGVRNWVRYRVSASMGLLAYGKNLQSFPAMHGSSTIHGNAAVESSPDAIR